MLIVLLLTFLLVWFRVLCCSYFWFRYWLVLTCGLAYWFVLWCWVCLLCFACLTGEDVCWLLI